MITQKKLEDQYERHKGDVGISDVDDLYLKDNKEGYTSFPEYDLKVKPKAGRLLMFPPLWTYKHIGHKPIKEPKYIVGSYLHYI